MAQKDADEWLRVAARELQHLPPDLLGEGCKMARRTCTHHGQIVPTVLRETDELMATRRRLAKPVERETTALPAQQEWKPTLAELDELKRGIAQAFPSQRTGA